MPFLLHWALLKSHHQGLCLWKWSLSKIKDIPDKNYQHTKFGMKQQRCVWSEQIKVLTLYLRNVVAGSEVSSSCVETHYHPIVKLFITREWTKIFSKLMWADQLAPETLSYDYCCTNGSHIFICINFLMCPCFLFWGLRCRKWSCNSNVKKQWAF